MRVIDNALSLPFKFKDTQCYRSMPTYNFWNGWWKEEPRNYAEQILKLLWEDVLDVEKYKNGGFEYWNRICVAGDTGLEWHQDDISDHEREKNYQIADKSMIYYPEVSNNCIGGFLEIAPYAKRSTLEKCNKAVLSIDTFNVERIRPITNRKILFDSAQLHRISPVYNGHRINFVSSLWKEKPKRFKECENLVFTGSSVESVDWKAKNNKYQGDLNC